TMGALTPWIGIEDPKGATQLIYSAGLEPHADGTMNHAWVEALLPDGHGGQVWQALDPSYKASAFKSSLSVSLDKVPFDLNGFLSQNNQQLPIQYLEDQIRAYLAQNNPGMTIADIGFQGPIIQQQFTALPVPPYAIAAISGRYGDYDSDP